MFQNTLFYLHRSPLLVYVYQTKAGFSIVCIFWDSFLIFIVKKDRIIIKEVLQIQILHFKIIFIELERKNENKYAL